MKLTFSRIAFFFCVVTLMAPLAARAQQTLGSIEGAVVDQTNAVVVNATVEAKNVDTGLVVPAKTGNDGSFTIKDLPIGTYELTITKEGFEKDVHTQILVRGNLTTTVNSTLQPGEVSSTVTVTATPLLNQTDTTNGYTLGTDVIQSTPLGTGSFTQLAILAPGVNADLLSGSGTNAGLGNQDIFANGQRDTSNTFEFNGVNANNIFNGKSSSEVSGNRLVLNTGEHFLSGGQIQTNTSVFDAIGQGLPSPPQETIEEIHVNTSMYDASQGATSGAHISLQTKSGTNAYHGQLYEYHQTTGWNANPFFFNASGIPRPALHRNTFGGTLGGPIAKNKLFFFGSYQGVRDRDELNSTDNFTVPQQLTNDRTAATLESEFGVASIDTAALNLLQAKLPNGQFLIPSAGTVANFHDATLQQPSTFNADQLNGNIDYDFSQNDRLAGKYYFQRDPSTSPFAISNVGGFPQQLQAGAQVASIDNTRVLTPNLTWEQRLGFIRETAFATLGQPFSPLSSSAGINIFNSGRFPGIKIEKADSVSCTPACQPPLGGTINIGPTTNFANNGVFQNQFEGTSNLTWIHGRHSISTGVNWDYNQLNIVNHNNQEAFLTFLSFTDFLNGHLDTTGNNSQLLNGATNRYYRTNQAGTYVQDDFRLKSNLSVDFGVRWDWDGPLTEKNGFLTNFYPQDYSYDLATDTVTNIGLVVAGNNRAFCKTKSSFCVSNSTMTGRQWGFAPRIGFAYSPQFIKNFVVRTGFGMYYDRGEFFTELSPSAGFGISGPFGVTVEPPFVVPLVASCTGANCLDAPFGNSAIPPIPANLGQVANLVPCQGIVAINNGVCSNTQAGGLMSSGIIQGTSPFFFGGYDPKNKIPYSENWTLDLQWQPLNTLMLDMAYVGNRGLHETMPIPFNEPKIATAANPVNGQTFSYGYEPTDGSGNPLQTEPFNTPTGGNTDLRVPFVGYNPNSDFWEAEGVSHYNALQLGVTKRLSQGLQINGSYTWSHALDEGSGLSEGLFYNGNDPLNPRSAYGNSGFDRTHVFTVSYLYTIPDAVKSKGFAGQVLNGWGISGITVAESGQPYSLIDFSGAVGSLFYSINDFITNPILPIASGFTAKTAQLQGTTGVNANNQVLNPNAFTLPLVDPNNNTVGVPPCGPTVGNTTANFCDSAETTFGTTGRNIFRGPFQTRFDFGVTKTFKINERFSLKYDAQFFNIFNHPSFDTSFNDAGLNTGGNGGTSVFSSNPCYGSFSSPPGCSTTPNQMQIAGGLTGGGIGFIQNSLGSPRFIQMALHLTF